MSLILSQQAEEGNHYLTILQNKPIILQESEINILLQNHATSCHGDNRQISEEVCAFLHELVCKGQWTYIKQFLQPLENCEGHTHSLYLLYRQEYIELLMTSSSEKEERVREVLARLTSLSSSTGEDYNTLSILSTVPSLSSHSDYLNWSVASSRDKLYQQLVRFLSRHVTPPTSRLVELIARGLFYESCERHTLQRYNITTPIPPGHMLDLLSWLQQRPPDSVYNPPLNVLPLQSLMSSDNLAATPSSYNIPSPATPSSPSPDTPTVIITTPPKFLSVTPPTRVITPLLSSTPRDQCPHRYGNHKTLSTAVIEEKEVWPKFSLATVFTEKQVVNTFEVHVHVIYISVGRKINIFLS